jgi:hypothetical protein
MRSNVTGDVDADALTSFARAPDRLFEAIKVLPDPQIVLTPHEGEFPRLFSDISNKHPGRSRAVSAVALLEADERIKALLTMGKPNLSRRQTQSATPCFGSPAAEVWFHNIPLFVV